MDRVGKITVGAGQAVTDIFLALVPSGMVSGRVTDRRGDAVKDAAIQALAVSGWPADPGSGK